jgi:hypothetical protein
MILFQVLLPLLTPLAGIGIAVDCASGNVRPLAVTAGLVGVIELGLTWLAVRWARSTGGMPSFRPFVWSMVTRVFYRPLLLVVLLRSLVRAVEGIPLGWNKLARRGTVTLAPADDPEVSAGS